LDKMDEEVKKALGEIAAAGVDMERIKAVIERDRRQLLSSAETSVTDVLTDSIVASTSHLKQRNLPLILRAQTSCMGTRMARIWKLFSTTSSDTTRSLAGAQSNGRN
jgi:hypothetical protein